jgi:hypothetical protein
VGWSHLKIFWRTTGTGKLFDKMQIQVFKNHSPQRSGGTTMGEKGEKPFLHVLILEKIFCTKFD